MPHNDIAPWMVTVIVIACFGLLSVDGCGRPSALQASTTGDGDFQSMSDRLLAQSHEKSVNGTMMTLGAAEARPDGYRCLTARRVQGDSSTDYTLDFKLTDKGWLGCEALAQENGLENDRFINRISGEAIGLDQLILWLGW